MPPLDDSNAGGWTPCPEVSEWSGLSRVDLIPWCRPVTVRHRMVRHHTDSNLSVIAYRHIVSTRGRIPDLNRPQLSPLAIDLFL